VGWNRIREAKVEVEAVIEVSEDSCSPLRRGHERGVAIALGRDDECSYESLFMMQIRYHSSWLMSQDA
jgi:hypothetical protein